MADGEMKFTAAEEEQSIVIRFREFMYAINSVNMSSSCKFMPLYEVYTRTEEIE